MKSDEFQSLLRQKGEELYRSMPWRQDTRPYFVLVSELMLQQTQVARVVPKFEVFIERFPNEKTLASANLSDVLKLWQGLGYNRRAKYLHDAVTMIMNDYGGTFPKNETDILQLPGVGKNTAGAILAYAFNKPAIFVETNIRTVYIHAFFKDDFAVDDKQILAKLEATIDRKNPRRFYQNLMDYGSWLKANGVKNNARSRHYKKQSPLAGSVREVRGQIIKHLSVRDFSLQELRVQLALESDQRWQPALESLLAERLIFRTRDQLSLTDKG